MWPGWIGMSFLPEEFLMILEGGPHPDKYVAPEVLTWPLPDVVRAKDHIKGAYEKVFESQGPADDSHMRGAKYVWNETAVIDLSE